MGGETDKRPGATTKADQAGGRAEPARTAPASGPGRSPLTGTLPKTTTELGAGPVRVTADHLNVRRTPQIEFGNVVGGLEHGQVVNAVARNGDWVRIAFGVEPAHVNNKFVEPVAPPSGASSPGGTQQVNAAHGEDVAHRASAGPAAVAPAPQAAPTRSTSAPAAPAATVVNPQPAPAVATHAPNDGEFATASGNAIAKTTPAEAAVLNRIRRDPRRLDPVWLEAAQHALRVYDATGAMNTETLRAMREHAHQPKLDAAGIMNEAFLTAIAPGKPFHEGVETGENKDKQPADPLATTIKDRTAQNLGYANFEAYYGTWGKTNVMFLGSDLGAPAHPYLPARLCVAEAYLRNRIKSPSGQPLNDAGIQEAIGWSGKGNASYAYLPNKDVNLVHPHAMGHAIDIDPGQNPYFFDHSFLNADFWVKLFEHLFQHASRLYGGDALTAKSMMTMSEQTSTEELYSHIKSSSQSFAKLLELSVRANKDESPTGEIATSLASVGYEGDDLKKATREVAVANEYFHKQQGRRNAKQATNQSLELVIALRDVAGLAWGGTEMSGIENGDFMHWDCRLTDFGKSVMSAASVARNAAAAEAKEAAKK